MKSETSHFFFRYIASKLRHTFLPVLLKSAGFFIPMCIGFLQVNAQDSLSLSDLSSFKQASPSWHISGAVKADLNTANKLTFSSGSGILVNAPDGDHAGVDLYSTKEYGDMDVELDYMMAKGSNSGIYLQGRYEIQLLDSWGVVTSKPGDNGGIYERWDESKPAGQNGYQGYAPRQSVSKAPGLWQHLKISFLAPRFDAAGKKIANAKMTRVELNGVVIHDNIELFGPTRGGGEEEKSTGPIRIQGDHGAVAFRNIVFTNYSNPKPQLKNLQYSVYKGLYEDEPKTYEKLRTLEKGQMIQLTSNLSKLPDTFLIRYTGALTVNTGGEYTFNMFTSAGKGLLKIDGQVVTPFSTRRRGTTKIVLPEGEHSFELLYSKFMDWGRPAVNLSVAGPGIREYLLSDANIPAGGDPVDPILIEANTNTLLRSFMDIKGKRVTHAVSVGSPTGVHYTYDMDNAAIVQVWRGGFLDATPMWHERGDGSSRPMGSAQRFGFPVLGVAKISSQADKWPTDTVGSGYRPKGYSLDDQDRPVFSNILYGSLVTDAIQVSKDNYGITREITLKKPTVNLFVK
ncbi:MAG: family 16 glycoside hydrolase, partial [Chitinophagaceae bacterium]